MKKRLFNLVIALTLVLTLVGANVQIASADKASATAPKCSCVNYVKNKYNFRDPVGYAKNMGPYLKDRGFWKLTTPRPGEIIIMKPAFGHGVDSVAGHVGIIQSVIDQGSTWKITVRGASQAGSKWTESNCNNVSFWSNIVYPKSYGDNYVEYWVKGTK